MADPVSILQPNAEINAGETARLSSFVGAIAIAGMINSTFNCFRLGENNVRTKRNGQDSSKYYRSSR